MVKSAPTLSSAGGLRSDPDHWRAELRKIRGDLFAGVMASPLDAQSHFALLSVAERRLADALKSAVEAFAIAPLDTELAARILVQQMDPTFIALLRKSGLSLDAIEALYDRIWNRGVLG